MALFGTFETLRAQAPRTTGFATAFAYWEELLRPDSAPQARLRKLAAGTAEKIDLGGGTFVMEQAYLTKPRAEGLFESHRKYIDVQIMFEGTEIMEVADLVHMTARDPYNPDRDLILHLDSTATSHLRVGPGEGAIFFPADVHMPTIRVGDTAVLVRKAVVKVPTA